MPSNKHNYSASLAQGDPKNGCSPRPSTQITRPVPKNRTPNPARVPTDESRPIRTQTKSATLTVKRPALLTFNLTVKLTLNHRMLNLTWGRYPAHCISTYVPNPPTLGYTHLPRTNQPTAGPILLLTHCAAVLRDFTQSNTQSSDTGRDGMFTNVPLTVSVTRTCLLR